MPQNKGTVRELTALLEGRAWFDVVKELLAEGLVVWTDPDRTLEDYLQDDLQDACLPIRVTTEAERRLAKPPTAAAS